jgi:hypothetical protein
LLDDTLATLYSHPVVLQTTPAEDLDLDALAFDIQSQLIIGGLTRRTEQILLQLVGFLPTDIILGGDYYARHNTIL